MTHSTHGRGRRSGGAARWFVALLPFGPVLAGAETIVVEGPRSAVRADAPLRTAAERCRDDLEATAAACEKLLPYRLPPEAKLILNLFAGKGEYVAAVQAADASQFVDHLACTAFKNNESYLLLQPRAEPAFLALVGGLPDMTRRLACHEGVHQYIYRAGAPNSRWWPFWYAEGMAEQFSMMLTREGAGGDTATFYEEDMRQRVNDALEGGRMMSVEQLCHAQAAAFNKRDFLYAHSGSFYVCLASDPDRLTRLHDAIRALEAPSVPKPGEPDTRLSQHARACALVLAGIYGPPDALDSRWQERVRRQHPPWLENLRSSQRVGDELVCAAFPDNSAMLVSTQPPPKGRMTLRVELQIVGVKQRQADLILGFERRDDPRFIKIALGSKGYISLLAYADGFWQTQFQVNRPVPAETFPAGEWVPVVVTVGEKTIRVAARGKDLFEAPVPPGFRPLEGRWGVGAYDEVVRYRNIQVP